MLGGGEKGSWRGFGKLEAPGQLGMARARSIVFLDGREDFKAAAKLLIGSFRADERERVALLRFGELPGRIQDAKTTTRTGVCINSECRPTLSASRKRIEVTVESEGASGSLFAYDCSLLDLVSGLFDLSSYRSFRSSYSELYPPFSAFQRTQSSRNQLTQLDLAPTSSKSCSAPCQHHQQDLQEFLLLPLIPDRISCRPSRRLGQNIEVSVQRHSEVQSLGTPSTLWLP